MLEANGMKLLMCLFAVWDFQAVRHETALFSGTIPTKTSSIGKVFTVTL